MRTKTESRRQKIIDIATRMFLEQGFERTSMSKIAAAIGGSKGTLYRYFPSKEKLFVEAIHHHTVFNKHARLPAFDCERDLKGMLTDLGKAFLRMKYDAKTVQTYRNVFSEAGKQNVGRIFYEHGPLLRLTATAEFLQTAMDAGRLRPVNAMIAAQQLFALFEAEIELPVFLDVAASPSEEQMEEVASRAVDVFMRAYASLP